MRNNRYSAAFIVIIISLLFFASTLLPAEKTFSRKNLMEDARYLAEILESAHPDPYINGGGKIAFHRRLHALLEAIPTQGMTGKNFYSLLQPFVAALKDSHTHIHLPDSGKARTPGLLIPFRIVDRMLCVDGHCRIDEVNLLGADLESIHKVPLEKLIERQNRLRGTENDILSLVLITLFLQTKEGLSDLIPEWEDDKSIRLDFHLLNGEIQTFNVALPFKPDSRTIPQESKVPMPSTERSEVAYGFLSSERSTALLRIDGMKAYREGFESLRGSGFSEWKLYANQAYQKYIGDNPPEESDEIIASLPSATEIFRSLVSDMKEAGTRNLIIDLRKNTGGNSLMIEILLYFLFGEKAMVDYSQGYMVTKYSPLYFEVYSSDNLERINKHRLVPLNESDYSFAEECCFLNKSRDIKSALEDFKQEIALMPTFQKEYENGTYKNFYRPENIMVLSSALTYSSGFNMMTAFYNLGAQLVGTPSSQAPNNFGDSLPFVLKNTGIKAFVSYKRILSFPDDEEKGFCLMPQHLMTYEILKKYAFDPNAEVLFALDILGLLPRHNLALYISLK
jgi:hypothetical protein